MKRILTSLIIALFIAVIASLNVSADEITGTWTYEFLGYRNGYETLATGELHGEMCTGWIQWSGGPLQSSSYRWPSIHFEADGPNGAGFTWPVAMYWQSDSVNCGSPSTVYEPYGQGSVSPAWKETSGEWSGSFHKIWDDDNSWKYGDGVEGSVSFGCSIGDSFSWDILVNFCTGSAIPEINYCPDGTEVLDDPVDIPLGSEWTSVYTTTLDALAVRYTITGTDDVAPSYLHGTASVNRASADFNEYTSVLSVTVPTTSTGIITGTPGVYGPVAEMSVENTGGSVDDDFTLLSACILEADPPDHPLFCNNGFEVLEDGPVEVPRGWGGAWEEIGIIPPFEQSAATIWLHEEHPQPSMWVYANDRMWTTSFETNDTDYYSVTVPTDLSDGGLVRPIDMEIVNQGASDWTLMSICMTETETISIPVSCNLRNHDFLTSTLHWEGDGTALSWVDVENGAAFSEPSSSVGVVQQSGLENDLRGTYEVSARIRVSGASSTDVTLRTGYLVWPDDTIERSVDSEWTTISGNVYLRSPYDFRIESADDIEIDWACISESSTEDGWRPEIPVCTFPSFDDHPGFSITSLLSSSQSDNWFFWLASKISQLFVWLECEIERIIMRATSIFIDVLESIDLPAFPDDISLGSLILWLRRTFEAFGRWIIEQWTNALFSGRTVTQWLADQLIAIAEWLWEDIILELVLWIMEQLEAAGLIGSDTIQRIMWMLRNIDIWLEAAADEIEYELNSAFQLFGDIVTIFDVLIAGIQTGLAGEQELDMGEDLGGFAAYLWRGVDFIDDVVDGTPLVGLNVVAMGVIAWGLAQWSLKRFGKMLEFISSSL